MKRSTFSHKPGFTLVEMIIIISVIAILSTISIIAYQYIRQDAYDAKAKTALQQVETGFKSYITAGNKVPMRYYSPYGFYADPGGGSIEQGIPVNHGGGIGRALVNAGFLSSNLLDSLKNKDDWYAEHGLSPSLSTVTTGTVNGPARYILAEIDLT